MSKVIVVSQDKDQYFFPFINSDSIIRVNPYQSTSLLFRVFRKVVVKFKLPFYKFLLGKWVNLVPTVDKIIIMDSGYVLGMREYLQNLNPNCDIHLFLWNHVNESRIKFIKDFNKKEKTWTFVKEDSERIGIKLNSTLYSKDVYLEKNEPEFDVLFVGREKGKAKEILSISEQFEEVGLKTKIHLISSKDEYPEEIRAHITNEFLSYIKYLELVSRSSALLDIAEPNNYGLSMRVLEAIYFNKKLITNNVKIKEEPFFNDNNIFVIDYDKQKPLYGLINFFEAEFLEYNRKFLDYYSIEEWIRRFR